MTSSSGRFLKGLILGSAFVGLGYYVNKNEKLKGQLSTKLTYGLNVLSENSKGVQTKVMDKVHSTKTSVTQVLGDTKVSLGESLNKTKSSLGESLDKTKTQLNDTLTRLNTAFVTGYDAAKTSLASSKTEISASIGKSDSSTPVLSPIKDSVESPLGATEDTSTENTSTLHPGSNNIAKQVGDAGTQFDRTTSGSSRSSFGGDNYTGI